MELNELNTKLVDMAAFVEQAISDSLKALEKRDKELALRVSRNDREVDRMEREIEDMCLILLLRQQPVAGICALFPQPLKLLPISNG